MKPEGSTFSSQIAQLDTVLNHVSLVYISMPCLYKRHCLTACNWVSQDISLLDFIQIKFSKQFLFPHTPPIP
jgi:hypothetical protein